MIQFRVATLSPLQKVVAVVSGLAVLALGVAFAVVLLPIMLAVGAVVLGRLWWRTRALRKAMRQAVAAGGYAEADGRVIDGEAVVVSEYVRIGEPGAGR